MKMDPELGEEGKGKGKGTGKGRGFTGYKMEGREGSSDAALLLPPLHSPSLLGWEGRG